VEVRKFCSPHGSGLAQRKLSKCTEARLNAVIIWLTRHRERQARGAARPARRSRGLRQVPQHGSICRCGATAGSPRRRSVLCAATTSVGRLDDFFTLSSSVIETVVQGVNVKYCLVLTLRKQVERAPIDESRIK